jgi:hypothetical protein
MQGPMLTRHARPCDGANLSTLTITQRGHRHKPRRLFWIDSDIAFSSQSVFRLLLADRDIAAGVYPMKSFNWPAEGVPAGMTRKQFKTAYTSSRLIWSMSAISFMLMRCRVISSSTSA